MKLTRNLLIAALSISLSSILITGFVVKPVIAQSQDSRVALQRGFRTGYSDGYMAGYRDTIDSMAKNYSRHPEYSKADRAYSQDYGSLEDYRDGYQQGFESGYDTGFEKRSFEAALPTDLKKRVIVSNENENQMAESKPATPSPAIEISEAYKDQAKDVQPADETSDQAALNATIIIPRDTELVLELQDDLNTQQSREGESFTARVISPSELDGATIEGRVSKIRKPGRLNSRSELSLSFDRIVLSDNRWSNFSATLTEVMPVKGDNVSRVDVEGTAIGQSSFKQNAIKVGATTGTGLVIGAVVGGPAGAAVGAGVGAAFGVGAVVINRGKHVRLNRNQQLRVKTGYETKIR